MQFLSWGWLVGIRMHELSLSHLDWWRTCFNPLLLSMTLLFWLLKWKSYVLASSITWAIALLIRKLLLLRNSLCILLMLKPSTSSFALVEIAKKGTVSVATWIRTMTRLGQWEMLIIGHVWGAAWLHWRVKISIETVLFFFTSCFCWWFERVLILANVWVIVACLWKAHNAHPLSLLLRLMLPTSCRKLCLSLLETCLTLQ